MDAANELLQNPSRWYETDSSGRDLLLIAAEQGQVEVVKLVLATKLNPNSKCPGRTPLSFAAEDGHEEVVRLLLNDSHVDPYFKDLEDRTSLWFAAVNGHKEVVKLLLSRVIEPDS
jgi:ankyrin repeat protein